MDMDMDDVYCDFKEAYEELYLNKVDSYSSSWNDWIAWITYTFPQKLLQKKVNVGYPQHVMLQQENDEEYIEQFNKYYDIDILDIWVTWHHFREVNCFSQPSYHILREFCEYWEIMVIDAIHVYDDIKAFEYIDSLNAWENERDPRDTQTDIKTPDVDKKNQ